MITKVEVLPEKDFSSWYKSEVRTAAAAKEPSSIGGKRKSESSRPDHPDGSQLLQVKGCIACHTTDGSAKIGPTLKGILGRKVTVVTGGKEREITADEEYIRRSLLDPQADIVKGFPPIMPPQKGLLTDKEIDEIIEYLKTL